MTPSRLRALTEHALGRPPTVHDLQVWGEVLACPPRSNCPLADCVHDDEADQALLQHRRTSTFPAAPADVRRIAIGLANARVERAEQAEFDRVHAQAVPPTEAYLAAAEELRRKQAARQRELDATLEAPARQSEPARTGWPS